MIFFLIKKERIPEKGEQKLIASKKTKTTKQQKGKSYNDLFYMKSSWNWRKIVD